MPRILVVEDESTIADAVLYALRADGLQAEHCLLGREALRRLRAEHWDVAILDVGLPDITGFELCRSCAPSPSCRSSSSPRAAARSTACWAWSSAPTTTSSSPSRRASWWRACARACAAPAAAGEGTAGGARPANSRSDGAGQRIRYRGEALPLTRYEYRLLAALLARPGAILSREQLMDDVWRDARTRWIAPSIRTSRRCARNCARSRPERDPIRTHRGLGYSVEVGSAP
jgi:two-component system catabolic regulation response regulator CreB